MLKNGVTTIATGTCGVGGTVSLTASPALTDGTYNLTATQTDPAGNTSAASTPTLIVVIDTSTPAMPVSAPGLQTASDSGSSTTDGITKITTPTLDVLCTTIGNIITLKVDGTANGTHTCTTV